MIYTFIIVLVSVLLIFAVARVSIGDGSLSTSFDKILKGLSEAIANKDKAKPDGSGNLQKATDPEQSAEDDNIKRYDELYSLICETKEELKAANETEKKEIIAEIRSLAKLVKQIKEEHSVAEKVVANECTSASIQPIVYPVMRYACFPNSEMPYGFKNDSTLYENPENCVFEISITSPTTAVFRVLDNADVHSQALINFDLVLSKTCKYDLLPTSTEQIICNLKDGYLRLTDNVWKIEECVTIKFM